MILFQKTWRKKSKGDLANPVHVDMAIKVEEKEEKYQMYYRGCNQGSNLPMG